MAGSSGVRRSGHLAPGQFPQPLGTRRGSWDCKGAACECGAGRRGGRAWGQRCSIWGLCAGGRHSGRETSPPAEGPLCLGLGGHPGDPVPGVETAWLFMSQEGWTESGSRAFGQQNPFITGGAWGWRAGSVGVSLQRCCHCPSCTVGVSRASRLGRHILPPTPLPACRHGPGKGRGRAGSLVTEGQVWY